MYTVCTYSNVYSNGHLQYKWSHLVKGVCSLIVTHKVHIGYSLLLPQGLTVDKTCSCRRMSLEVYMPPLQLVTHKLHVDAVPSVVAVVQQLNGQVH